MARHPQLFELRNDLLQFLIGCFIFREDPDEPQPAAAIRAGSRDARFVFKGEGRLEVFHCEVKVMGCDGERTRCPLAVGTSPWQQIQLGRELRVERK